MMSDFFDESFKYQNSQEINISKDFQPAESAYGYLEAPDHQINFYSLIHEKFQFEVQDVQLNIEESIKYENSSQQSSIAPFRPENIAVEPMPLPLPLHPLPPLPPLPSLPLPPAAEKPCKCKQSKCTKGSCACHKGNRKCSDLCRCKQCDNHRFKKDSFIRCQSKDFGLKAIGLIKRKPISKK